MKAGEWICILIGLLFFTLEEALLLRSGGYI